MSDQEPDKELSGPKGTSQLVHGLAWTALFRFTGQGITWAISIAVIRFLHKDDYGLMGKASVFIGFLALLSDGGMGESLVQKKSLSQRGLSALFWIGIGIALVLYLITATTIPLTERYFDQPELGPILLVAAIGLILNAIGEVHGRLLVRELRFREAGICDLTAQVTASVTTLTLAILGAGVYSLVVGGLTQFGMRAAMRMYMTKWKPNFVFKSDDLGHHLKFGGAVVTDRLLWYAYTNADFIIAGAILAKGPYGVYAVAFNLASLPLTKVTSLVNSVLYPVLSRMQSDREQHQRTFLDAVRGLALLMFPALIGLTLVAPEFVRAVLGPDWQELAFPLAAIAAVNCLRVISPLFSPLLSSIGKPGVAVKTMFVALVIMAPTFYFASRYGMRGLALGWLLGYPVVFTIIVAISCRAAKLSVARYFRAWIPAVLCTCCMAAAVLVVHVAATSAGLNSREWGSALVLLLLKTVAGAGTFAIVAMRSYGDQVRRLKSMLRGQAPESS
ncbi:MAG: lipopolysaccharide biosynthesis protein [Planctomycetota bacterium]|nr:lipopolysaccharide biosynthesis protein [Planctomycetota bacterium]